MSIWVMIYCSVALISIVSSQRPEGLARITRRDYARVDNLTPFLALQNPATILDHRDKNSLVSKIMIPRIPGSEGSRKVQQILTEPFQGKDSKWNITTHTFTASTPVGKVEMTNLIMSRHPFALRQLVLACHYDSLSRPRGFIGATDSAVPCALIIDTALALEKLMNDKKGSERWHETGLQLIFFDGEEAYKVWTHTDSTYGSRALADHWSKQYRTQISHAPLEARRHVPGLSTMRTIDSIEHFVLLDLLGTPHPRIPRYFADTGWIHDEMRSIEERLAEAGLLFPMKSGSSTEYEYPPRSKSTGTDILPTHADAKVAQHSFFANDHMPMFGIEDDHLPFLANGVPICHLIPSPFPAVWHTMADNAKALDYPTVHAWAMIMRVFVAEYLGLNPDKVVKSSSRREHNDLVGYSHHHLFSGRSR